MCCHNSWKQVTWSEYQVDPFFVLGKSSLKKKHAYQKVCMSQIHQKPFGYGEFMEE